MRRVVQELIELGPLPTDEEADAHPVRADRWEHIVGELSADGDVTNEEASRLVALFPHDESDSYGVVWTLVHVVESAPSWPLVDALASAEGPWIDVLRQRASATSTQLPLTSMNAMQAAVAMLTNLLAAGDHVTVERMTQGRQLSAADLERVIRDYGRTLISLPRQAMEDLDVVQVRDADPPAFSVVVDLWTREEGRSDLTLELDLVDRFHGAYDVSIQNLHVL